MLAVSLALLASAAYGVSDFLGGVKSRALAGLTVLLVSQAAALVVLTVLVGTVGDWRLGGAVLVAAALAGVFEICGIAALYRGLAVGTMGVAPIAAAAPVVPVVVGAVRGEPPTPVQYVGIALAIVGIVLTAVERPSDRSGRRARLGASAGYGFTAALGFGGFYVAINAASDVDVLGTLWVARLTSVTVLVAVACLARPRLTARPADLAVLVLLGMLIIGADSSYAVASTHGTLGVVAALSSLHPLVTIGLGWLYLHEKLRRVQQGGALLCICGVAAVVGG